MLDEAPVLGGPGRDAWIPTSPIPGSRDPSLGEMFEALVRPLLTGDVYAEAERDGRGVTQGWWVRPRPRRAHTGLSPALVQASPQPEEQAHD